MAQGFSFEEAKTPVAPASSGGFSFEEALKAEPAPEREDEPAPKREAVSSGRGTIIPPLALEPQPEYKMVQAPQKPPAAAVPPTPISTPAAEPTAVLSPEEVTPPVTEAPVTPERPGLQPFTEFGKGVARAATADLPSMWEAVGVQKDVNVAKTVQDRLSLFDKIDAGEITSLDQLRGTSLTTSQARSYLSTTPDMRERMRQRLVGELANRKDLVNASIKTLQAYQEDAKKYRPAVDRPRDIGSVTDFTNWVAGTMGSAAVQFVPMMLAAATTGGVGLGVVSVGMGTAESVLNRAKYIQEQVKDLPPEQQAEAVFNYIQSTGDTSLATGIASGALDVVFGPAARLLKLRAGAVPPAATRGEAVRRELKQVPKQMGSEGLTGAAQQAIQTAGAVGLGEKPEFLTRENLLDIAEAGLTEAVGAPIGSAVNVATAAMRAPARAKEAPPEAPPAEEAGFTFEEAKAPPTEAPPTRRVEPTAGVPGVVEDRGPELGEPAAVTEDKGPELGAPAPVTEDKGPELGEVPRRSREEIFEEEVKDLMATLPLTEEEAKAIVTASMQRAELKEEQRAAIEPPIFQPTALPATELNAEQTARLRDLTDEFIAAGNPPEQAAQLALTQVNQEIEADALAATTAKGAKDVGEAVPTPSREGVPVAGEPPAVTPTAGLGGAKPDGVVPVTEDAGQPTGGKAAEPGAVTPTYTPSSAVAARITELENEQKGLLTKAGKVPAPKSKARVRYDELQADIDLLKSGDKAEVQLVEQRAMDTQGVEMAKTNAAMAFDQRREYADLQEAIDSYRENVRDTLTDLGIRNQFTEEATLKAFDAEVERLRAAETPTETKPAAPPAKRGRPAVERTEEQKAALEEQRKVTKNAVQKADYTLKKMQAQLDAATKPLDEGAFDTDEALKEAQDAQRADKRAAIRQMLLLDEEPSLRGTAVGKRVKAALKDPRITPTEVADIKRGIEVARKSLGDKSTLLSAFKEGVGPVNRGVSRATTAVQALNAVVRNGSPFQRLLADRLLNFARGVKFVVLEEGQAIPAELQPYVDDWERANGMFVPDLNAIYVRGASFGDAQGVNNITVLHEVLHAATNQKIVLGLLAITRPGYGDSDLQQFVLELATIMEAAKAAYEVRAENGTINPEVRKIYERTDGEVFDSPQEFLAYGMSDPDFQLFLMRIRTIKRGVPDKSGFSKFVRTIMRTFGFGPGTYNLFSDLINVTDNIISARKTPAMRFAEKTMPPSAPLLQRDKKLAEQEGIRSAKTLAREQKKAEFGYQRSKLSNDRKNLSLMQKARDAGLVQRAFRTIYSKADTMAKTALANAVSFDFLARETEDTLPPIKAAYQVVQKMIGHIHALQEAGIAQIQMLDKDFKADKKLEGKLNEVLYQSSVLQVDPSDPKSLERSKVLDRMYSNLGLAGQKAYQRIIRFHDSLRGYQEYLLNKQIQDLPGLTKEVKDNLLAQIIKRFQDERRIEPYVPLVRDTGEFWLAVGQGDDTQIYIYETREQRNEDAERIAREDYGGKSVEFLTSQESGEMGMGNEIKELRGRLDLRGSLLPKLFDAVDAATSAEDSAGNKSAREVNEKLKDDIFNIWLSMLPEQSFRRQFTQRKSRPGYRPDIRRNIGSHMARLAPALGRLRYGQELRSEQIRLRELVRVDESLTPFKKAADSRIDFILAPKERGFWDAVAGGANKLTYLTYLTGVITALLQPMSIYISALPILAANHKRNPAMVAKELGKMVVYLKQYGITKKLPDGRIKYTAPTLANNKSLPEDELRAIRAMTSMNVAQQTYAGFLWDVSNADALAISDTGVKGFAAKTADLLVNALMRNSERLTREIVYLASYRLGRQRGLSEEDAIIQAASDVKESLGDYDIGSRPTWMQGPIGRVAFSMKMYPVIVTQQLFGNMYRMLPFLNKEGKVQALTKFSGIMMTAATLAGAYNMPFADLIIQMLTSFLDDIEDEDKPEGLKELDPVTWFKEVWMPDKLGEIKLGGVPLNELIGEGPLVLTGRALGQRIGLNDLWSRDGKPSKNISEAVQAFMLSYFGGPISSYVQSVTKGLDDMAVGDYERAFERIVPLAHARNFMVMRRSEKEGYETPGGILVSPEEVTKADLAWQAMGVTPADVAAARDMSFKLTGAEQKIINERNLLINRIKFAHRKGKDNLSEKLRYEDIPEFNEKHPEHRITWEQVSDILKDMDERKAKARAGVVIDKKTQRIFEEAVENMEERLGRRQEQK